MSGHGPRARSPERFQLERILGVETVEGIVQLSVQISYEPWDGGSIYDHLHAINGLHEIMIRATILAEEKRSVQCDDCAERVNNLAKTGPNPIKAEIVTRRHDEIT
jgi:hypothetical protein